MPIPGQGYSSPVISGDQIWMTSAEKNGKSLHAICLNLASGNLLHNIKVISTDDAGSRHRLNGYASPTPYWTRSMSTFISDRAGRFV